MTVREQGDRRVGTTTRRVVTLAAACAVAGVVSVAGCSHPTATPVPSFAGAVPDGPSTPPTASQASVPSVPTPAATSPTPSRLAPVRIRIPAIGVDAVLVRLGLTSDGALAVPTTAKAAGWYTGSPVPGRMGPAVIAGHVHWSGIPAVFAHLAELAPGDRVLVARSDGSTATFAVDRVATYPKSRFPTALVYGPLEYAGLRVITCGGFDPVARAYEANVVVFATLVTT